MTFNFDVVKYGHALKTLSTGESVFLEYLVLFSELHDCVTSAPHLIRDRPSRYNRGRWLMTHLTTPNTGLLSEKQHLHINFLRVLQRCDRSAWFDSR